MGIPNYLPYYQSRVPGLIKEGVEYRARCPIHQGNTETSFALNPRDWSWFCHGACNCGGGPSTLEAKLFGLPITKAKQAVDEMIGLQPDEPVASACAKKPAGTLVAAYDYHYADGTLAYQVCRYDPKDFRQRKPVGAGRWDWKVKGLERLLYRLPEVLNGTGVVYIAEGEKDVGALRALGLNATCNSGGAGKFTPSMAKDLAGRDVVILPDDDVAGRKHAEEVATLLRLQGCRVKIVRLPAKDPAEWLAAGGTLDELRGLQAAAPEWVGKQAVKEAPQGLRPHQKVPHQVPANVHEMLGCYAVLVGSDTIFDRRLNRVVSQAAVKLVHGDDFKLWSKHEDRLLVDMDKLVFRPEGAGPDELNLFGGLPPLTVHAPDAAAWFSHIRLLCGGHEDLARWVVTRLAYKLQNPGVKVATSIVIHGEQGTGKNLLFKPLLAIYGRYAAEIGQQQIDSPYTDWCSGKLLLVADEVAGRGTRAAVKNKLKALITSEDVAINEKFASTRWERNCADIHFLSNDEVPVVVEPGDRRFCIIRCDLVQPTEYYARLAEVDPGALKEALLVWDCGDFHAHTKPPATTAKRELVELTQDPTDRFLDAWFAGETPLPVVGASKADLYRAYEVWSKTSGERQSIQSATFFGRLVAKRIKGSVTRTSPSTTARVWLPEGTPVSAEELASFHSALQRWIDAEQRLKL
jgi:putative DNA primase/helicase